jgi:hypothetical protein
VVGVCGVCGGIDCEYIRYPSADGLKCPYRGSDRTHKITTESVEECRASCINAEGCKYFSMGNSNGDNYCIGCRVAPSEEADGALCYAQSSEGTLAHSNRGVAYHVTHAMVYYTTGPSSCGLGRAGLCQSIHSLISVAKWLNAFARNILSHRNRLHVVQTNHAIDIIP